MRGKDIQQSAMFSYVSPENRVPADHPLRPVLLMADLALKALSPVFQRMYATFGPSLDSARETTAGFAAAGSVHHPQ
jgi:hypothetical protein